MVYIMTKPRPRRSRCPPICRCRRAQFPPLPRLGRDQAVNSVSTAKHEIREFASESGNESARTRSARGDETLARRNCQPCAYRRSRKSARRVQRDDAESKRLSASLVNSKCGRLAADFSAPRVGLEPTTNRLTGEQNGPHRMKENAGL
jgi:hypothetical protein